MADFKINGKTVVTQSGIAEPVLASNVTFPAGHVIQTQSNHQPSAVNTSSTSLISIISVAITPSSTSNKIAIFCTGSIGHYSGGHYFVSGNIWADTVSLFGGDSRLSSRDDNQNAVTGFGMQYLHSPNSTSSITYALAGRSEVSGSGGNFTECDIIVMEIVG
jgi:hypothetical protein